MLKLLRGASGAAESVICPVLRSHEIGLTERLVWLYSYGMQINGAPLPSVIDIAKALRFDPKEVFQAFVVLQKEEWLSLLGDTYILASRFDFQLKRDFPLKSIINAPEGPSPVLSLIRHYRALYLKQCAKKAPKNKTDFAVVRGLVKTRSVSVLTSQMETFFKSGKVPRPTLKDFRVYVSKIN